MSLQTDIEREMLQEAANAQDGNGKTLRSEITDVLLKLFRAANGKDKVAANSLLTFAAAMGAGTEEEIRRYAEMPDLPRNVAKLPIYNIGELAADYRRFVKEHGHRRFNVCGWLPGLRARPLVPGEQLVIVADTGVGKTTLAQNLAKAARPLPVLMFQLELPKTLLFERYVSMDTGIDGEDIFNAFLHDLEPKWNEDELNHVFTCDRSGLTPEEIGELIVQSQNLIGVKPAVVIIDYIGLIGGRGERYNRVSDAAEKFKIIAKNTNTIFIVIAQVSRPADKEGSSEPKLHSAKDSGSIENSGGLVLTVWRDPDDNTKLWVKVAKNSKGKAGRKICCEFSFPSMRITEMLPEAKDMI